MLARAAMHAAILYEPDAYRLDGPKLMGRQVAGNGFLRAAVAAQAGAVIAGYTPYRRSAQNFFETVRAIDPAAKARWISGERLEQLADPGVLFRPDHALARHAMMRLRAGPATHSLCGLTHTLSGSGTHITDMLAAPMMPWDALICTSTAAAAHVRMLLEEQAAYIGWRFGIAPPAAEVRLPVIPLGVHCDDFAITPAARTEARRSLGIADAETAFLFAGRLSIAGKAHPITMAQGLQAAAERTGRPLVLILAGQVHVPGLLEAYQQLLAEAAPLVRVIHIDGKDADRFALGWAAADVFLSLADSIQETFGITPLEAMAAGLPVVVTDWNGYRDTVRDGIDGFRIPTWAPPPSDATEPARSLETDVIDYNLFLSVVATTVSLDMAMLVDRLEVLIEQPALRAEQGAAGQAHVRAEFDWTQVYRRYQGLWDELDACRRREGGSPALATRLAAAPRAHSAYQNPFKVFGHFPAHHIVPTTQVSLTALGTADRFRSLTAGPLLNMWNPPASWVEQLLALLADGPVAVIALAAALSEPVADVIPLIARLAKLGLVRFD